RRPRVPAFDTSALIPLFDKDHGHHGRASKAFRDANEVLVHPCVLEEFTRVMRRIMKDAGQDGNAGSRQALAALLAQPRVRIVHQMPYDKVVELYLADSSLSFTDAVVSQLRWEADKANPVAFDDNIRNSLKMSDARRHQKAKPYLEAARNRTAIA
ncbi:MAG: PIN domain-containing protein, partial [Thermoplasmatota archaeon]